MDQNFFRPDSLKKEANYSPDIESTNKYPWRKLDKVPTMQAILSALSEAIGAY